MASWGLGGGGVARPPEASPAPGGTSGAGTGPSDKVGLFSLIVYKWDPNKPVQLALAVDLSSFPFFQRGTIKEHITFHSRLIASRTPVGRRQIVEFEHKLGHCHSYVHPSGLCVAVLSTASYPMRVAFGLISQVIRTFQEVGLF
eukprot:GHVT01039468.1.p1 GENE.GHVT01039468.1~~GHVT01039468.1.p1  ORF type:complete len:144 (+),score=2.89 GHVT01039468.1:267-698(+)